MQVPAELPDNVMYPTINKENLNKNEKVVKNTKIPGKTVAWDTKDSFNPFRKQII